MRSGKLILCVVVGVVATSLFMTGAVFAQDQSFDGKRVGVVELYNNPFWVDAERGIKEVLDPLGVEVQTVNSNGDGATPG